MSNKLEKKLVASMQGIALDSINKAGQGHIGMAIGAAPITYTLFGKHLNINQNDPKWINRDRFVLSAGHGSMSIYSIMHFLGLLSKQDMMDHKHLHSKTPSHPEIDSNDYIDASTGPLGQGVAMAVGMALSQKYLQSKFNKENFEIFNHDVYALHGDGCIQEGVALEAIQLAGTLNLDRLILIHDFNNIQIDSHSDEVNGVNLIEFFKSQNFETFVANVNDLESIDLAIQQAKKAKKPSYIQVHSVIAANTPNAGKSSGHNGILKPEETLEFKKKIGLTNTIPFEYDNDVYEYAHSLMENKNVEYEKWLSLFESYKSKYEKEAEMISAISSKEIKYDLTGVEFTETNVATRNYINTIMKYIDKNFDSVVGGSADLAAATKVAFSKQLNSESGKNIKYGIREFAMAAINNGIYLDMNLKTVDGTFLAFADYMKAGIRLGALMEIPSIHVFTHDSYQVGGDGPTHQPFDQIPMLRAMSNVKVVRPCDEFEMLGAFQYGLNSKKDQIAIIGCRQNIKSFNAIKKGSLPAAYVIKNQISYDLSILASGSEVQLAVEVSNLLEEKGIKAQVVSVPVLQDLVTNESLIKTLGLNSKPIYAIEATSDSMWYRLAKYNKFDAFLAEGYGWSEDGQKVYELKGFEANKLVERIQEFLK
ncbi:transketolase [Mycoplasma anatis]|uniref:transketolase n=1 Tax=Mycoplasmopsis anatis TaxID=171279 RepID=A0A9Q3QE23_9BACT|nr:transketolase [Mycoplasmopsis anatis]MBW0596310.1 transketolase [Mycoplasmopsis anatis]MBW0596440.1 transketolase [Mycoplasmopsis anatis]MBW0597809.1 transketolase [Mycoplasmopsis anatis]MBW0598788.1 transketolase [Mycoplasmopsis anatis]MBW0599951.1 transketolase [Mycoplasmopsis anatis]